MFAPSIMLSPIAASQRRLRRRIHGALSGSANRGFGRANLRCVAYSPDGKLLPPPTNETVVAGTPRPDSQPANGALTGPYPTRFSPDGMRLAPDSRVTSTSGTCGPGPIAPTSPPSGSHPTHSFGRLTARKSSRRQEKIIETAWRLLTATRWSICPSRTNTPRIFR